MRKWKEKVFPSERGFRKVWKSEGNAERRNPECRGSASPPWCSKVKVLWSKRSSVVSASFCEEEEEETEQALFIKGERILLLLLLLTLRVPFYMGNEMMVIFRKRGCVL